MRRASPWHINVCVIHPVQVARLNPRNLPAEAKVIQLSYGHYDRAQTIHAIALFPGDIQRGLAAANALAAKLRDRNVVRAHFSTRLFGLTHFETVGEPFLVRARGWLPGMICLLGMPLCNTARAPSGFCPACRW